LSIPESIAATPPFRPSQLATSYLHTAHVHHEHITQFIVSLHYQHEAIRIASNSLDLNVLAVVDTFEGISVGYRRELEKQAILLAGIEADLSLISRVRIHVEFMSSAVRKSIEAGDRPRMLGDYVSNVKMKQVAEICARTHGAYIFHCESRISLPNHFLRRSTIAIYSSGAKHQAVD
jgi:autophagy-related protein 11